MNRDHFFQLVEKYHSPAGRYNYYPRISAWQENLSEAAWHNEVNAYTGEVDLYIHIPFCAKFCHFCGCNIKVGQPQDVITKYLDKLVAEWKRYNITQDRIANIFIGGGTPNSLNKEQFAYLFTELGIESQKNIAIEADPRKVDKETFYYLKEMGLRSISLGIQDLNNDVLNIIGRPTDNETLKENLEFLKSLEIENISMDLLYGLPKQGKKSLEGFKDLLSKELVTSVSLYPFANVPWFQDFYPLWEENKPDFKSKYEYYFELNEILEEYKFSPISFGHFFKEESKYYQDFIQGTLKRNIMGHCRQRSDMLIGIGVSAISSTKNALKQNYKIFENYMFQNSGFEKSHLRSSLERESEILFEELSTKPSININKVDVSELVEDGLLTRNGDSLSVTKLGRHFIQHIAKSFEKSFVK